MRTKWGKHICVVLMILGLTSAFNRAFAETSYIEGDAWPFTTNGMAGDGEVTYLDWQTIMLMALGRETPINSAQFSVADCAPRETLGDGSITTIDVIQAERFSVGYDWNWPTWPPVNGNGPTNAITKQPLLGGSRTIFISNTNLACGQEQTVDVCLAGDGTEVAAGFSLDFDPSQLRLIAPTNSVGIEDYPGHGVLTAAINSINATNGHFSAIALGVYMAPLPPILLSITFQVIGSNSTAIHFSDYPTLREVSDTNSAALPATYQDAVINFITVPQLLSAALISNQFQCIISGTNGQSVNIESSTNLQDWDVVSTLTLTNDFQPFKDASGESARYYRALTP